MNITIKNIKSFIEGNVKYYADKLDMMPDYIKEQVAYRVEMCKDTCIKTNKCKYCGCPPLKKAWVKESCNNQEIFPDIMEYQEWEDFKTENKIIIE